MVAPSHLRSFQALELALRIGSLKGASEVLGITPAAVGQRIKTLEEFLGVELLVRGRFGLQPTSALAAALGPLTTAFRELGHAAELLDIQRGQEIRIGAVSDFAEIWLLPRMERFRRDHPNIVFSVNGEGDAPMRVAPVDCEITFAARAEGDRSDLLFRDYLVPIGSPENTQRIGTLPKRDRLEGFPLLHLDFYKEDPAALSWSEWIKKAGLRRSAPDRGIRFQRIAQLVEAVRVDAGLAICGLVLVESWLQDATLSLPFGVAHGRWTSHGFQARFRVEALSRAPVRRFREWLLEECAITRQRLAQTADSL